MPLLFACGCVVAGEFLRTWLVGLNPYLSDGLERVPLQVVKVYIHAAAFRPPPKTDPS